MSKQSIVLTPDQVRIEKFAWGEIRWLASGAIGNSDSMTFGKVIIQCGRSNPRHVHGNCDEVLHLLSGRLEHTAGAEAFPMSPGDTICIPKGTAHNAKAIGSEDAIMVIAFSSAHRETRGE